MSNNMSKLTIAHEMTNMFPNKLHIAENESTIFQIIKLYRLKSYSFLFVREELINNP